MSKSSIYKKMGQYYFVVVIIILFRKIRLERGPDLVNDIHKQGNPLIISSSIYIVIFK